MEPWDSWINKSTTKLGPSSVQISPLFNAPESNVNRKQARLRRLVDEKEKRGKTPTPDELVNAKLLGAI